MNKNILLGFLLSLMLVSLCYPKDEGMWMPNQIAKFPWAELRQRGLELSMEQLYNENLPSLKDAVVLLGGGTGSFVSSNGLILTNYHVVVAALQSASSTRQDYIKNGYTARKQQEEFPVPSYTAKILVSMKEVTQDVLSSVNDTMSAELRAKTLKAKIAELEAKAKGSTDYECHITDAFFGLKYFLNTYEVLRDIRLVLSPPASIGAFGGEEDNWMWPRHTGDFAFMRAYVAPDGKHLPYSATNVPYKPKMVLPISVSGYKEGTYAMILGFPGLTLRQMVSPGLQAAQDVTLPYLQELTKAQLEIVKKAANESQADVVNYATKIQAFENTSKYIEGTLTAIKKKKVITLRQAEEIELWDHIFTDSTLQQRYGTVMIDLDTVYAQYSALSRKQIAATQLISSVQVLRIASVFKDYANSFKDGEQPNPSYKNNLKNFYIMSLKTTNLDVDKDLLNVLLQKAAQLPEGQQFDAINKIIGKKKFKELEKEIKKFVEKLYKVTKTSKKDDCDKFVEQLPSKIREDAFVKFAIAFDKEYRKVQDDLAKLDAKITLLLSKFEEVKLDWKKTDTYPDANQTLRFSYGEVKSYVPRNSVFYNYYTTLSGVMEKEWVEKDAFLVPPKLHRLWTEKNLGSYTDSSFGDVPVAFITTNDVSGGSSGSPVLNGKGELMGIAFDGNWEGLAGDYLYQESLNRSISVDCRYVLFYLEKYTEAQNLLQELTIKK